MEIVNPEAERLFVGCLLREPMLVERALDEVEIGDLMTAYRVVYAAIVSLHYDGVSISEGSVIAKLRQTSTKSGITGLEAAGGPGAVLEAASEADPKDYRTWVNGIRQAKARRDLYGLAEYARQLAEKPDVGPDEVQSALVEYVERMEGRAITETSVGTAELRQRISRYLTDPEAITGYQTGWAGFDRQLDGLQPGNVTIVYAPSSRFKSMFVTNIGLSLSRGGVPGLWFTTEMPTVQVQERLVQMLSRLNFRALRDRGELAAHADEITRAIDELDALPIYINDTAPLTMPFIQKRVNYFAKARGIGYVIVDLVDMVISDDFKDDSVSQQASIMRSMKALAKKAGVHIILVSHINKGYENDFYLTPERMKGSSAKYQDVDTAISLMPVKMDLSGEWKPLSIPEISMRVANEGQLTVMVYITKNRHGPIGELLFTVSLNDGGLMWPLAVSQAHGVTQGHSV